MQQRSADAAVAAAAAALPVRFGGPVLVNVIGPPPIPAGEGPGAKAAQDAVAAAADTAAAGASAAAAPETAAATAADAAAAAVEVEEKSQTLKVQLLMGDRRISITKSTTGNECLSSSPPPLSSVFCCILL